MKIVGFIFDRLVKYYDLEGQLNSYTIPYNEISIINLPLTINSNWYSFIKEEGYLVEEVDENGIIPIIKFNNLSWLLTSYSLSSLDENKIPLLNFLIDHDKDFFTKLLTEKFYVNNKEISLIEHCLNKLKTKQDFIIIRDDLLSGFLALENFEEIESYLEIITKIIDNFGYVNFIEFMQRATCIHNISEFEFRKLEFITQITNYVIKKYEHTLEENFNSENPPIKAQYLFRYKGMQRKLIADYIIKIMNDDQLDDEEKLQILKRLNPLDPLNTYLIDRRNTSVSDGLDKLRDLEYLINYYHIFKPVSQNGIKTKPVILASNYSLNFKILLLAASLQENISHRQYKLNQFERFTQSMSSNPQHSYINQEDNELFYKYKEDVNRANSITPLETWKEIIKLQFSIDSPFTPPQEKDKCRNKIRNLKPKLFNFIYQNELVAEKFCKVNYILTFIATFPIAALMTLILSVAVFQCISWILFALNPVNNVPPVFMISNKFLDTLLSKPKRYVLGGTVTSGLISHLIAKSENNDFREVIENKRKAEKEIEANISN
ncbi:MAG: hypothetical protein J0H68_01595 [Sphingobacteriia bacterium]|nr:hypothetical protein [Sphingobacteriia bacterium]